MQWKINQASIQIQFSEKAGDKISNYNYRYCGGNQGLYVKFTGIASGDYVKAAITLTGTFAVSEITSGVTQIENNVNYEFSAKHVNYNSGVISYKVSITQVADSKGDTGNSSNYTYGGSFPVDKEFTIQQILLDFTWGATDITYTGSTINYPLPTIDNLITGDQSRIYLIKDETLTSPDVWSAVNVGTYYAHLSSNVGVVGSTGLHDYRMPISTDPNYGKMIKQWKIVKRVIQVAQFASNDLTYNTNFQIAKILKVTGLQMQAMTLNLNLDYLLT